MARGWESKSVEQQQDDAQARATGRQPMTAEEIANENKRLALQLSRQRVLRELESATNQRRLQMLEAALHDLEAKLTGI